MLKKISYILLFIIIAFLMRLYNLGLNSQKMSPTSLKENSSTLMKCTSELNCVKSSILTQENKIQNIVKVLASKPQYKVVKVEKNYLYFTDQSSIFGFVDDVEFLYEENLKKLHYKSSSRVGKSDLGANKKRIDRILQQIGL
ncbi:DUF1499 domain-containing protein [Halobacteriovorax sp. HLS]|uniref:DUF1499 domain-containing protein n=1 Tax=Halobacteriovorax sp. HLS TaxID=2234000 RepID=UPI000FD91C6B|nr:DUF1499 domain-containing protein [Halobacteriovorax sp. HLS]